MPNVETNASLDGYSNSIADIETPASHESIFNSSLSAEALLPVIDNETREAVESLMSLDNNSNEIIYKVALKSSGDVGYLDLPLQLHAISEPLQTVQSTIDWNASVNNISQ